MTPDAPTSRLAACKDPRGIREYHPLEVIPYFRRFAPTVMRDVLYTFIWNCGLGFIFWFMAIMLNPASVNLEYFVWNMIVANAIGYTIHGLFEVGGALGIDRIANNAGGVATALYYVLVSTAGVLLGFGLVAAIAAEGMFFNWLKSPRMVGIMAFSSIVISILLSVIFFWRERTARAETELERERVRIERVEREAVLANLRALQAQIEPHFLFNTLANVVSLVDPDPAKAKRMLESFIRFLRASLAATRSESTTLAEEAELIAAYLEVLQIRMGTRLRYAVDVPPELHSFAIAPMLLQPVIENSIRHGLEPKIEGGEVAFRARREGGEVLIEISDTGVGFAPVTRGGVGLTNLRERLRALYGERASLSVAEQGGAGALVTLRIPA